MKLARAWQATLVTYTLMLLAVFADHFIVREVVMWPIVLMQLLPLLIIAPGVVKKTYRGAIWLCFITLFYFLLGVDNTVVQANTTFYACLATLSVLTFISALFAARWSQRA